MWPPAPTQRWRDPAKAVEQRLARAGLLKRAPDGRYGPDTLAALQGAVLAK